jgi:methylated-DNA-[protein]-cysteine S-methyltransferase
MIALTEHDSLCGLWFAGQKHVPADVEEWRPDTDHPLFVALRSQLAAYFAGQLRVFDLPLAPRGTPFQLAVWTLLRAIPPGETTTYGTLAGQLVLAGRNTSARAVGGAVGRNPLAIVIPCHRVVGSSGSLTGYAGGLERKVALLALEKGSA